MMEMECWRAIKDDEIAEFTISKLHTLYIIVLLLTLKNNILCYVMGQCSFSFIAKKGLKKYVVIKSALRLSFHQRIICNKISQTRPLI